MSEENLGDEPTLEDVQKERDELKEKLEVETQNKSNLVSEIKELREKKTLSETEAKELKEKIEVLKKAEVGDEELTPERIAEISANAVQEIILKKEESDAKANKEAALKSFQSTQKEFHPENDEAGIKISALDKVLSRFNLADLKTKEDFLGVYTDAFKLLKKEESTTEQTEVPHSTDNPEESPTPSEVDLKNLTKQELDIIDRTFGGDKERYLKIKEKRPDYVDQLLTGRFAR